jgi:hypothetical protein
MLMGWQGCVFGDLGQSLDFLNRKVGDHIKIVYGALEE